MQPNTYASLAATKPEVSVSEFRRCRSAGVNNTLTTPKKNLTRKFRNSTLVTKLFLLPQVCCQKWLITTPSITHIELKRKIHTQHVAWGKKKWFLKTEIVRQLLLKASLATSSS